MYGSVIAKFDFPIYKTDEAIKHEQDSLLKHFQPYYSLNPLIEKKQVERFLHDYEQGINGLPKEYVGIVARQMQEIYQMGIINTNEYNNIFKDSTSMIRFVSGKNAKSLKVSSFYSTIAAYEHIFANEKLAAQRAILSRCNLNNYIEANIVYDKEKSDAEKNDLLSSIPLASGMVMSGQKIIDRGEIVNDYTCRVLNSFDKEMKRRSSTQDEIMTTFIGQNLGAGQFDRAKQGARIGILCSMAMAELIGVALFFLAPYAMRLFNDDPAVVAIGVRQSHIEALFFCFLAFAHGVSAVLRGAGRAQVPMYTMLGCWCILRVSYITLALKVWPDIATIFWAYPITWSVSCVVFLIYYLKADWVHALEKSL